MIRSRTVSKSVATERELTKLDGAWSSMTVSGNLFVKPGKVELALVATDALQGPAERVFLVLDVKEVSASAALGDRQLDRDGTALLWTRWFYDLDRANGMMNGKNLSTISTQIKSPFRSGSTEVWPDINFSHNIPEAGTGSSTVQPHRGLDIERSNGQPVWAVIGGTVTLADETYLTVTTRTNLGGGVYLFVQYEHVNPDVIENQVVTSATQLGTVGELNHLHLRFDNPARLSMPQRLFWLDSPWETAADKYIDFIRRPTVTGSYVTVQIHGYNVDEEMVGEYTKVWHKRPSEPLFRSTAMSVLTDGITWRADLGPQYGPGELVYYYIETRRADLDGWANEAKEVYRPVYYKMDYVSGRWDGRPPLEYFTGNIW